MGAMGQALSMPIHLLMKIRIFTELLLLFIAHPSWSQKPPVDTAPKDKNQPASARSGQVQPSARSSHADHIKSGTYDATKLVGGEVRKIDLAQEKITIRHDEIRGFMPRMTMVYTVKTPKLLKDLMIGERIQFLAVEENGKSVVTKIQRDICE